MEIKKSQKKNKINNDNTFKCKSSNYLEGNNKRLLPSVKKEEMEIKKSQKFECTVCLYHTDKKFDFYKHTQTIKHKSATNGNENPIKEIECSDCKKKFKTESGIWKHKQKCNRNMSLNTNNLKTESTDLVKTLLTQNQEFKTLLIKQQKESQEQQQTIIQQQRENQQLQTTLLEVVKEGKTINNTTHSHNKFNLNVFLNEKCKNAISMDDFINSIDVTLDDYVNTGQNGFIKGISDIVVNKIQKLETHRRPLHCTDLKRQVIYIKNEDKWEMDITKSNLRNVVKKVAKKNENMAPVLNQNIIIENTEEQEKRLNYYITAIGSNEYDEKESQEDKIIKNVLKEVVIDKDM